MFGKLPHIHKWMMALVVALLLSGCGDDRPEQIAKYQQLTQQRLTQLNQALADGQLRNANLLRQYADLLAQKQPELSPLLTELAKDSNQTGPMFTSLSQRVSELSNSANFIDLNQQLEEAENLYQAVEPALYNDMLSDPVNVIADMSHGMLSRVNAMSREAEVMANGSGDFGPGSQLVGNPGYGSWQTNSSGTSFWAWYGMYSMFSNIFNRPVYYDNWSSRRGYSYYNDVGRYRYTSPKQARSQERVFEQSKKKFSRQGKNFSSPYAKNRTGSSSLSRQSVSTPSAKTTGASSSKFRSSYAKSSTSSFRNSSNRTSRGIRSGK
ncbi:hypothetical protein ACFOD0_05410 [Shewanella intestini]|uniref:CHAD domain-containing protein n=1 Tax=Shewanella intestini TaxID=2017544 RepID=A0ABS5I219_9GAMM|nr:MULTISPECIES: hypothetical protein [Shewanella]MBR9727739.1 hypothetical protein [Shewanella intestini]MRG35111.1 hypothetical protein [Shewanella sp. XMDDZSB0408]